MNRFIIFMVMLASSISLFAQKYKASELYEAKGLIKEIVYEKKLPFQWFDKQKFKKNGKQKGRMFLYGKDGRALGDTIKTGGYYDLLLDLNYNSSDQLTEVVFINKQSTKKKHFYVHSIYTFDSDDISKLRKTFHLKNLNEEGETVLEGDFFFSDYKFDDHGNWISRMVEARPIVLPDSVHWDTDKIEQTRTITYYKEKRKSK